MEDQDSGDLGILIVSRKWLGSQRVKNLKSLKVIKEQIQIQEKKIILNIWAKYLSGSAAKVSDLLRMDERATRMRERTSLLEREEEEEEEVWYCCDFMEQEGPLFYVAGFSAFAVLAEIMLTVYLFSTAPVFS